jgi:hypothetical protein
MRFNNNVLGSVSFSILQGDSFKLYELVSFLSIFITHRGFIETFISRMLYRVSPYLEIKWNTFLSRVLNRVYYLHLYDSEGEYMGCFEFTLVNNPGNYLINKNFVLNIKDRITECCQN